jgi:hypothetical protein
MRFTESGWPCSDECGGHGASIRPDRLQILLHRISAPFLMHARPYGCLTNRASCVCVRIPLSLHVTRVSIKRRHANVGIFQSEAATREPGWLQSVDPRILCCKLSFLCLRPFEHDIPFGYLRMLFSGAEKKPESLASRALFRSNNWASRTVFRRSEHGCESRFQGCCFTDWLRVAHAGKHR